MDLIENSLLKGSVMTLVVLGVGLLIGLQLDDARTSYIEEQISDAKVNTQSIVAVQNYMESSNNYCRLARQEIPELGERNAKIGATLQEFSSKGVSESGEYIQLRQRYYVSELRLYNLMSSYKKNCKQDLNLILYFFSDNIASQRQGNVLTEYRQEVDNSTSIFTFNLAAQDSRVVDVLTTDFNVTEGPTIVVNGDRKYEGYVPLEELKRILGENQTVNLTTSNKTVSGLNSSE